MPTLTPDTVNLIRDTLAFLEEEAPSYLLASQEDADFFRNAKYKTPNAKSVIDPVRLPSPAPHCSVLKSRESLESPPVFLAPPQSRQPRPPQMSNTPIEENGPVSVPVPVQVPAKQLPQKKETIPVRDQREKAPESFSIRSAFLRAFPDYPLIEEIPDDAIAVKICNRWKTKNKTAPISILILHEPPEQRALLEQVATALDVVFGGARAIQAEPIEKEKQWGAFLSVSDLKLVVVCDYTLWQLGGLMAHYKENPTQGNRTLGTTPLFLLPDLSLYLKDPLLKRSLWKALCQKLNT